MADVKKTVQVEINVTGTNKNVLSALGKAFDEIGNSVKTLSSDLGKLNKSIESNNNVFKKSSATLRTWGERLKNYFQYRLIADGLFAIKAAVTASWTAIKEYDQALKDLQAITGATALEVEQMGETIQEVASTTKFSASEVAEGMRIIGQAGFSASEAVQTMQAVSDLATGTLSSMASTVDLVTTAMRVFKIDASESASVADVFANAVNRSKLTIDKLRTSFNYVGPIARDVGVSFKETAAAMMTLANSGLRASTIGTGLRRVFAELADPSKKLSAAVHNAGLSLADIDPQTKGLKEVIANLGLVVSDTSIAFDIFGKRGAAAALALTDAEGQFNQMLSTVGRSGIAAQQAAKQMEGLGVQFKNLQDKLGLLAIQIGKTGITEALRFVINALRTLVDALTAVVDTAFVKFIVKAALVVAALTAITGAVSGLIALKTPAVFLTIASAVTKLASAFAFLEVQAGILLLVFNPLILVLAGLTATAIYLFATLGDAREAAEAAAKLADEYATLSKQFKDHRVNTVNMKEGSDELKEANLTLRDSLLKVATGTSEVAEEAAEAAAAIDPLTGKINEQTDAIKNYNQALADLTLDKLIASAQAAEENITSSVGGMSRWVNRFDSAFSQIGTLAKGYGESVVAYFEFDFGKIPGIIKKTLGKTTEYGDRVKESFDFTKALANNEKSFQEFDEYVQGLRGIQNLTDQEKVLQESFRFLDERTQAIFEHLVKFEEIDLNDSGENIKKHLTENLKITGLELDSILKKVEIAQGLNADNSTNIIEKWAADAKDGKTAVVDFIDTYRSLGGTVSESNEEQIKSSQKRKEELIAELEAEKALLKESIDAGEDRETAYRKFYEAEAQLLQESKELRAADAENTSATLIRSVIEAEEAYEQSTNEIREKYKNNIGLMTQYLVEAETKFAETRAKLVAGVVDPKKLLADIKVQEKEIKATYATMYQEIELAVLEGRIKSQEEGNRQLRELQEKEATELEQLWTTTYDTISKASDPDSASAQAARKKQLAAQIKQGKLIVENEKEVLEELAQIREDAYDRMEATREVTYKKYEANINKAVSDGIISFEDGEVRKLAAEIRRYEQALQAAKSYRAGVDQITDPDEYTNAIQAELEAEEDLYDAKSKVLEDYNKKTKKLSEDIIKDRKTLSKEEVTYANKFIEIKKSNADKLVDIEDDYADSIRDINYDLQDKLVAFEEERLDSVKKYADKRKGVEEDFAASINESSDSIQDSIDKIRQSGLEGTELERDKEIVSVRELSQLEERLSKARKEGNAEEVNSIIDRTDAIQDMYEDMADTGRAISGLNKLKTFREEALTTSRDLSLEAIDEEERIANEQREKDIAHEKELYTRKITDLKQEYDEKLTKQETIYNDAIDKEEKRHNLAMENIRAEAKSNLEAAIQIEKAKQAINSPATQQAPLGPATGTSSTASPTGTDGIVQGTSASDVIVENVENAVQAVESGGTAISNVLTAAMQLAKDAGGAIGKELKQPFEEFIVVTDRAGNQVITTTNTLSQGFSNFGDSVGKPLESVKQLKTAIDGLTDNPIDTEVKTKVENPEQAKKDVENEMGTLHLPAGIDIDDIEFPEGMVLDKRYAVNIPFKLKGEEEFHEEDVQYFPPGYSVEVPIKGKVEESEEDRISKLFSDSTEYSITIDDKEFNTQLTGIDNTLNSFFKDIDAKSVKITPVIDDTEIPEIEDQEVDVAITGSGSATLPISEKIDSISQDLESMATDVKVDIEFNSDAVDDLIEKLNSIDGRVTRSTHIIKQVTTGAAAMGGLARDLVQGFSDGGAVFKRLASPFITMGSGLKDDVPAMLKKWEFVQRPEAVKKYGLPFMRALNSLKLPKNIIPGFSEGGLAGGVSFGSDDYTSSPAIQVNFENIVPGGPSVEATMSQLNVDELMGQLAMRAKYRS